MERFTKVTMTTEGNTTKRKWFCGINRVAFIFSACVIPLFAQDGQWAQYKEALDSYNQMIATTTDPEIRAAMIPARDIYRVK